MPCTRISSFLMRRRSRRAVSPDCYGFRDGRALQAPGVGLVSDPWDDFVQHRIKRGGGLEAEDVPCLADVGNAHLDVVLEGCIADIAECAAVGVDLVPDALCKLEDRRRRGGRKVEVVVD